MNLYNALVVHVTVAAGPRVRASRVLRPALVLDRHAYDVGGAAYTCDDIEHDCLAAPAGSVADAPGKRVCRGPFRDRATRRANAIVPPARALALVCGAKSCPPIRLYDAEPDAQLAAAAAAFVGRDARRVRRGRRRDHLKIVGSWYKWVRRGRQGASPRSRRTRARRRLSAGNSRAPRPGSSGRRRRLDWDLAGVAFSSIKNHASIGDIGVSSPLFAGVHRDAP